MNLCAHGPHRCRTQLLFCYPARTAPGFVNRFFIALLCKAIKNGPVGRPGPRPKISSVRAQSARMRVKNSSCAIIFYINTTPLCGRIDVYKRQAHDIGKYSAAFQRRLTGDSRRVDHATAGAFECMGRGQDVYKRQPWPLPLPRGPLLRRRRHTYRAPRSPVIRPRLAW